MDFFKSVFADDPELSDTENAPISPSNSQSQPESPNPNDNPNNIPAISNAWTFGSTLFKTIASKSESVMQNYRRDIEEFSSGLKKETATIREVASRAVKDLPARLESGAAVAQESLESVGQAIDNIGSTVSEIIAHGKDSILVNDSDSELSENSSSVEPNLNLNAKPYSRIDAMIRGIQSDAKTYCDKPEDLSDYNEWKLGFVLEEKSGEIEELSKDNALIGEIYSEVVPNRVDRETFWSRYFYKVYRIRKAEETRAKLVKRAISGEEEELSWDVDDEDYEDTEGTSRVASGTEAKGDIGKEMDSLHVEDKARRSVSGEDEEGTVLETKSDGGDEKGSSPRRVDDTESRGDRGSSEGKNDNNSDFSVISSQLSSHEGDDLGWDEIEEIASGDEIKVAGRMSPSRADLRKRLSAAEEEEELTWDIEDDDEDAKS